MEKLKSQLKVLSEVSIQESKTPLITPNFYLGLWTMFIHVFVYVILFVFLFSVCQNI